MIKMISKLLVVLSLCFFVTSSIFADDQDFKNKGKSRIIVGLGIQFDANSLGGTIVKDGLDSGQIKTDSNGNYAGQQKAVIAENKLQTLENLSGGLISYKSTGPMTAGSLTLGYEKDVGDNFFWRAGINFSTKISGGRTSSTASGYDWYDVTWYYKSLVIPVYFGIKLNVGSRSAIYVAPGLHYYQAEWQLKGRNDGNGLDAVTGGLARSLPVASDAARPGVINEDTKFSGSGFGMSWLTGVQTKVTEKGYAFIEVENHFSYKQGNGGTKSSGGIAAIAPQPAYPVTVGGTIYRVGYKHEL
ncbi:MAG TPA: porin OmpL1 [Leptospiraceae bacterium]|nr:porin OmpL1 [Leptospiraceae bacterium]